MTGEGQTVGPPDKTLAAGSVVEEDVRTLWTLTDTGISGSRSETQSSRAAPPPFPHGILTRRLLPKTVADKPRASTEI